MKLSRSRALIASGVVVTALGAGFLVAMEVSGDRGKPDADASPTAPGGVTFDESTAVQSGENEFATIYTDSQGVNRAIISAEPQHVWVDGAWQATSSLISTDASGDLVAPLSPLSPTFAKTSSATQLVALAHGDSEMAVGLKGVDAVAAHIESESTLGTESGVAYTGAVGGSDLIFGLDNGTLREAVVLASAPASAPVYEWVFQGAGLSERTNEFGDFEFVDSAGAVQFTVYPPVMWDSSTLEGGGESATTAVDFTMTETGPGSWMMTLRPSIDWLSDPARAYPVFVDPTFGVGHIHAYKEGSGAYDFGSPVRVGNSKQTSTCCAWRTVMRFDLDPYFATQALSSTHLVGSRTGGENSIGRWGGLWWATAFSVDGIGTRLSLYVLDTGLTETENGSFYMAAVEVNNDDIYSYEMLTGEESNSIYAYKSLNLSLAYDYVPAPVATTITAASTQGGVRTGSPVVEGQGSESTQTGLLVQYTFTTTTAGASNWTSPWVSSGPYRVPDHALTPGATYTYTYSIMDKYPYSPVVAATPNPAVWKFTMDLPPNVPTAVTVDGRALDSNMTSGTVRPVVAAAVSDVDGGSPWALFTIRQGGIIIVDSLPGSPADANGWSSATLPYALSPDATYTIEVRTSDGYLVSATSYAPPSTFTGPPGSVREIPGPSDSQTAAVPTPGATS